MPTFCAITWSLLPSFRAAIGVLTAPAISLGSNEAAEELSIRRKLQKHFLKFDVYIPLEDIIVTKKDQKIADRTVFLMQKICGTGMIYVWVPLRMRLPIVGETVYDWCWKPIIEDL